MKKKPLQLVNFKTESAYIDTYLGKLAISKILSGGWVLAGGKEFPILPFTLVEVKSKRKRKNEKIKA